MYTSSIAALCLACLLLCAPVACAQEAGLSPRQQELWDATLKKLTAVYAKKGITPNPMSKAEVDAIRVPLVCDASKTGPLPWDVRLLLQFDRDLIVDMSPGEKLKFFDLLLTPETRVLTPDGLVDTLEEIASFFGDAVRIDKAAGKKAFLQKGASLPTVLRLSQIGGDELPGLWLVQGTLCTPVVHFDYDDVAEFYLRSLCVLDYVSWYIDAEGNPESLNDEGTDKTRLLTPEEEQAALTLLQPQLAPLNEALDDCLLAVFPE